MAEKPKNKTAVEQEVSDSEIMSSAAGLRAYMEKRATLEAMEEMRKLDEQAKAKREFIERLSKPVEITPEMRQRLRRRVKEAAAAGQTSIMVMRFPSELLSDRGRAINNNLEGWENTLVGVPRQLHEEWKKKLQKSGFKLRIEILEYPGGMPGDVGIFLSW